MPGAGESGSSGLRRRRLVALTTAFMVAAAAFLAIANPFVSATSGGDPYSVPPVVDTDPAANVVETTLTAEEATVDIGGGVEAHAQTFSGQVPGPTFELNVGDTVIVRFQNHLRYPSGIHWHGIELANAVDGTPVTQDMVPAGGSFIYKFTVPRPGIYWYHPHHHASTNQVFRGMYGMIVVRDPNEAQLQQFGVLPSAAQTREIVLSDTTVCEEPGSNPGVAVGEPHAYDDNNDDTPAVTAPWAGSSVANALPAQAEPSQKNLCEGPNVISGSVENPYPVDENGDPKEPFAASDIPSIQTKLHAGRTNEGTIVLTNGRNVGARAGGPKEAGYVPGALAADASTLDVQPGQGLRLQIVNAATTRIMRLQLTEADGDLVPLYRVGGEGGLLNSAVLEGGTQGGWETKFTQGEILLLPGQRADVVAAIPPTPTSGVLTLWTGDYERLGGGYVNIPTVPVMHLNLSGPTVSPPYKIEVGTELRDATGDPISFLGEPTAPLLDPAEFDPPKDGLSAQNITLTANGTTELGIDGTFGTHEVEGSYVNAPHLGSSRYAKEGDILELSAEDRTGAHHTFHLHGFSFQPIKLDAAPLGPGGDDFTWPYPEFVDNLHVPPHYRLTFGVKLDPRTLADGVTPGGALGRWVFHCHIFFHHTDGMVSELVVTDPSGNEPPNVNVDDAEPNVNAGATATVTGAYKDPDGDPVSLNASRGHIVDNGDGRFTWTAPTSSSDSSQLVYITATDSRGLKGQIPFYLQVGPAAPEQLPGPKNQAPILAGLKVTPKVFAAAKGTTKLRQANASRKKRGTKIHFNLSESASVRFTVKRVRPKNPRVSTPSFSRQVSKAGSATIGFTGRFKKKKALPPGKYQLTAEATDSGGLKSKPLTTTFRIVR
ncbi:MAG TPA: multicopper oxidase domain-containing protein [Solirubrobacterales bacterium]|nr:multicopper oxidase domain-containing protein [Solirubrobacterales bacterium]